MKYKLLLWVMLLVLMMGSVSAVINDAESSWSYNDNSAPLADDGSASNTLTNNGATRTQEGATTNYYYDFDGTNDFQSVADNDAYDSLTAMTVCAWAIEDTTGTNEKIVGSASGATNSWQFYLSSIGGKPRFLVSDCGGSNWEFATMDSYTIDNSNFDFVCGTWDASRGTPVEIFIDGDDTTYTYTQGNSGTVASTSTCASNAVKIGAFKPTTTEYFDGSIDQVMIYDRVLSDAEILELYNSGTILDPYAPSYQVEISNLYMTPNVTIYTDSSVTGTFTINDTTESPQANFYLKVDNVTVENKTTTTFSSGTATSAAFTTSNFKQDDYLSICVTVTNSTQFNQTYAAEQCTGEVIVSNRIPSASLSWDNSFPLNDSNFTGRITPSDSDSDTLNITYDIYKNGVYQSTGTNLNNAAPYGTIDLFTIDSSTTNIGDNYSFNVSITDAYDSVAVGPSDNATVTDTANFTITVKDQWSNNPINSFTVYIDNVPNITTVYNQTNPTSWLFTAQLQHRDQATVFYNNTYYEVPSQCIDDFYPNSIEFGWFSADNILRCSEWDALSGTGYVVINDFTGGIVNLTNYGAFEQSTGNSSTLITSILSNETANITVESNNYFNKTYTNYNLSENIIADLYQSEIRFSAYELITNDSLTGVTYTIDSKSYDQFNLSVGTYEVTASKTAYYDYLENISAAALDNKTIPLYGLYDQVINITAVDVFGTPINNFNITIVKDSYEETYSTTSGRVEAAALKSNDYVITINGLGTYASTTINLTSDSSSNYAYEFTLFPFNSVNIKIYDFDTLNLINQEVTIEIINDDESVLNSTSNGTLLYSFLVPFDYELRFNSSNSSGTNYNTISKFLTVTNDSTQNLTVYMTTNTTTDLLSVLVTDGGNDEIEGAVVWLQKQKSNTTDQWLTIQEAITTSDGTTAVYVVKSTTDYYRFAVSIDGVAYPLLPNNNYFTTPTFFIPGIDETVQIRVNLAGDGLEDIADKNNFTGDVELLSDNRTFNFTFIDGSNRISGGKLYIYGQYLESNLSETLITVLDLPGSSGYINYTVPEVNNTYFNAYGYVYYSDGREQFIDRESTTFTIDVLVDPDSGLLYAAVLIIIIALLTYTAGPLISSIMSISSLILLNVFGFVNIPVTIISSLIVLAILLFMKPKKSFPGEVS